ncbi:MAG: bifunctional glutamate N-acetyltransferase/amino-acid acetyltransferase ArgJ [Gammaproteobacteria bacterium]|nr:bifunctional glutamate N-acetyltransferase/amino-acid acetyltransferase ArgJ [Gammaproteobacteria bacterium]
MPVNLPAPVASSLLPIKGIKIGIASAGIKIEGKADLVLIKIAQGSTSSAVYTKNAFCAAPVTLAKQHQQQAAPHYLLINSGNANAGTGEVGMQSALRCCQAVAELAQVSVNTILPFSTGVIGQQLPVDKMTTALPTAYQNLISDNWFDAAHAIMTTDTVAKAISKQIEIDGKTITVTGMAKGSGMIRPDMATMLSYIATDAAIEQSVLDAMLNNAVEQSFNRITVDGDTSTNDACVLIATGQAANSIITSIDDKSAQLLYQLIADISQQLAHAIVRDGEGATKFIAIDVQQGLNTAECRQVAYTIAHSPLVKTALFASDPNWGRILAAVGRSGVTEFDLSKVTIYLDNVCIVKNGEPASAYTEEQGQSVMNQDEITIKVELGRGTAKDTIWTCDFSYDYVKINAEYRT